MRTGALKETDGTSDTITNSSGSRFALENTDSNPYWMPDPQDRSTGAFLRIKWIWESNQPTNFLDKFERPTGFTGRRSKWAAFSEAFQHYTNKPRVVRNKL
jgi:hypothetical protein